jgi:hypothetical protein
LKELFSIRRRFAKWPFCNYYIKGLGFHVLRNFIFVHFGNKSGGIEIYILTAKSDCNTNWYTDIA